MAPDTARVVFAEGNNSAHESLPGWTVVDDLVEIPGSESAVQLSRYGMVDVAEMTRWLETQHGLADVRGRLDLDRDSIVPSELFDDVRLGITH